EECAGVAAVRGVRINDTELGELHARTQGWAAGMVLLLQGPRHRAMQQPSANGTNNANGADGAAGKAPSVIFDYVAEEIFAQFPPGVQEFLLRAAYLPQVSNGMVALLGPGDEVREAVREYTSTEFLVTIVQRDPELVFQFHPLLREFLLARAEESGTAAQIEERRQLVAGVLAEQGYPEEAAALYIRNRNWDALTGIIRRTADPLLE